MKNKSVFLTSLLIAFFLLSYFSFTSCQFSTARIVSTEFVKIDAENKKTNVGTTYSPEDAPFHLMVSIANAPDDTRVKASWFVIDAGDEKNKLIDEAELTVGDMNELDFSLSLPNPWPVGSYKVDLTLNGKFDRSIAFKVQ